MIDPTCPDILLPLSQNDCSFFLKTWARVRPVDHCKYDSYNKQQQLLKPGRCGVKRLHHLEGLVRKYLIVSLNFKSSI